MGQGLAIDTAGGLCLGQHGLGDVHLCQDLIVPLQGVDVEQHGTGSVGIVGDMSLAAGQLPDQPGFDGAEEQIAGLCLFTGTGNVLQDPAQLGAGEVCVDDQTGLGAEGVGQALFLQAVAVLGSTAALPDDGVADGLAGGLVPDDGGFALVGDADGGDVSSGGADVGHGLLSNFHLDAPDFVGVMLDPAGLGEELGELLLGNGDHLACFIKENAAVGGGAGVQSHDVLCHSEFLLIDVCVENLLPKYRHESRR